MAGPDLVLDARAVLGEGPLWDPRQNVLWWLDIAAGEVHAFDPATGHDGVRRVGSAVGAAVLRSDGALLLGLEDRVAALDPETGSLETVAELASGPGQLRCNDGRGGPDGSLWLGRMALDETPGAGSLLHLGRDGRIAVVLDGLTCPNGMAWLPGGRSFVFIDSPRRTLVRHAWDPASETCGPSDVLLDLATTDLPAGAVPDGMTIDAEDHLWVAIWGGGCLLRIAPDGGIADRVDLPVSQPTSCAFAGRDLADLYVTSARQGLLADTELREPHAGGLFRFRPGVGGRQTDVCRPFDRPA
jgi:sugar lactone lactonase YvrE